MVNRTRATMFVTTEKFSASRGFPFYFRRWQPIDSARSHTLVSNTTFISDARSILWDSDYFMVLLSMIYSNSVKSTILLSIVLVRFIGCLFLLTFPPPPDMNFLIKDTLDMKVSVVCLALSLKFLTIGKH